MIPRFHDSKFQIPCFTAYPCLNDVRSKHANPLLIRKHKRWCDRDQSILPKFLIALMTELLHSKEILPKVFETLYIKQLLDEVFVICGIINVEVRVISRAEGEADNSYRDIDNFAYHKNRIR